MNNSDLAPLLVDLGTAGVELAARPGDAAGVRFRPATLAPGLASDLRAHKAALAALLSGVDGPYGADALYVLGERLGIADDLGMPTHRGSPAWLVAMGKALQAMTPGCARAPGMAYSQGKEP